MSKSNLRKSKTDRSTLRRVERAVRAGWEPGLRPSDFYRGSARTRLGAGRNVN